MALSANYKGTPLRFRSLPDGRRSRSPPDTTPLGASGTTTSRWDRGHDGPEPVIRATASSGSGVVMTSRANGWPVEFHHHARPLPVDHGEVLSERAPPASPRR